ncbi:MAG: GtrA family protein [Acidimicrobiia bacterium]
MPSPLTRLKRFGVFMLAGLPAFVLAIGLNIVLVERTPLPAWLAYPLVLWVQVTINFFLARRFVFEASTLHASLRAQYVTFLAGVSVVRAFDWLAYVIMVAAGVYFVAAQLINVVAFSVVRFLFARRVIEGPARSTDPAP